jgi:hypothetical protein
VIKFIAEHKDHQEPGPDGAAGLTWGVEPLCAVLSEHGIKISWPNARSGDLGIKPGTPLTPRTTPSGTAQPPTWPTVTAASTAP